MTLSVLSVGYPLAQAGLNAVGGSEQILAQIDRGLIEAGAVSHVIAPEGSCVRGHLHALPAVAGPITEEVRLRQQRACAAVLARVLAQESIDVVHLHGLDFATYAIPVSVAAVASLHLPPDWYPRQVFSERNGPWLLPVSETQAAQCPASPRLLAPLPNGVPDELFDAPLCSRDGPALMLVRICPEKGAHLALQAAHAAGIELVIAGQVYPYPEHERYFAEQIAPLLDDRRRFIGPVGMSEKIALLQRARCVLAPSLVAETSSLVVREAAAMGCPVIAFPQGHLAQSVVDDVTGYLVDNVDAMASAMHRTAMIDGTACRAYARAHFSGRAMVQEHLALYRRMMAADARAAAR